MSNTQEEDMKPGVQINLRAKHQEEDKTRGNQGARIKLHVKSQTPDELGMKDGDEINAMFHPTEIQRAKINLKVTDQYGQNVFFHIHKRTQLKKLLKAYCNRKYLDFDSTVFLFNGARFCGEQTSDELGMKDGDVIYAMFHQTKNQGAEINPKVEEELKEAVDLVDELNAEAETLVHLECLQLSE